MITAGTAIREAVRIIREEGGVVVGIVVALDRGERVGGDDKNENETGDEQGDGSNSSGRSSAIGQIRKELGIPVLAVLTLEDVINGLRENRMGSEDNLKRLEEYRSRYRATD